MVVEREIAKLAQTKLALAKKYDRLAKIAKSKPKKRKFAYRTEKFRRQAEQLPHK